MTPEEHENLVAADPLIGRDPNEDRKQVVRAAGLITAALVVAALYFASEVLIPVTLALLLTFILAPLVQVLHRIYVPRVPATVLSVLLALGIIVGIGSVIGTQIADLAGQLPAYQSSIEEKLVKLRDATLAPITHAIERMEAQSEQRAAAPAKQQASPSAQQAPQPVPVQVQQPPLSPLRIGQSVIAPILHPLATILIMLVVTLFALLYREDLRDRAIRLFGSADLSRTTTAMDDAAHRLSRYFIAQLSINSAFGEVVAIGTYFIGLPHPILWGVLGTVLRFVPYIGAWAAAALPTLLAAAISPGWSMVAMTAGLFAVTEFSAGQIFEPLLYGHSTGLSPLAVIIAAIFWTWLWGPIGLIISTPLTLCAVVIGHHFEQLAFLDILLGSRAALRPSETLYQRLLAGDVDEAEQQLEDFAAKHGVREYYDDVAIEALQLASADFRAGKLSPASAAELRASFEELVEAAQDLLEKTHPAPHRHVTTAPSLMANAQILCLPGRGPFDDLATLMLAQLFRNEGVEASTSLHEAASRQKVGSLELKDIAAVCGLYLEIAGTPANARFLIRRLKQRSPNTKVVLGLLQRSMIDVPEQTATLGADGYVSSLQEALDLTHRLLNAAPGRSTARESSPVGSPG